MEKRKEDIDFTDYNCDGKLLHRFLPRKTEIHGVEKLTANNCWIMRFLNRLKRFIPEWQLELKL